MGPIPDLLGGAKATCMDCLSFEAVYFLPEKFTEDGKPRLLCKSHFKERLDALLKKFKEEQVTAKKKKAEMERYLQTLQQKITEKELQLSRLRAT